MPSSRTNGKPFDASLLALHLIVCESGSSGNADALESAAVVTLQKMERSMVALVGTQGVSSLTTRALQVAKRVYPALADVTLNHTPSITLDGLDAVLQANADLALAAAIPEQFICVLIALLGEEVGLVPIRKTWPDAFDWALSGPPETR